MPKIKTRFKLNVLKMGIFHSLRFRVLFLVTALGMISAISIEVVIMKSFEKYSIDARMSQLQNQCTILCDQMGRTNYFHEGDNQKINEQLLQLSSLYDGRLLIVDNKFKIIEDTYRMDVGKTIISPEVMRCMIDGKTVGHRDIQGRYMDITSPIKTEGNEIQGVMLASVSTDSVYDVREKIQSNVNIANIALLFALFPLAIVVSTLIVRPFNRIAKSADAVSEGHGYQYFREDAYAETSILSHSFNKMFSNLKTLNDSRQEFVANVSHELKTPLTSMKVLADSLISQEDVPVEIYREFMEDLSQEIEREDQIINDLLDIVKMDIKPELKKVEKKNINTILERILKILRPIAVQRNIELVLESYRSVDAEIDEGVFFRVVANLVENAIKYNRDNGWVNVILDADHRFFSIKVVDSGIGIPEDEIKYIFERFYRVDKSHSREVGGTGLGLSIVKSAVAMHMGTVKAESQIGVGTTFTVRIPLSYIASDRSK